MTTSDSIDEDTNANNQVQFFLFLSVKGLNPGVISKVS